jgi:hypothetical protein
MHNAPWVARATELHRSVARDEDAERKVVKLTEDVRDQSRYHLSSEEAGNADGLVYRIKTFKNLQSESSCCRSAWKAARNKLIPPPSSMQKCLS